MPTRSQATLFVPCPVPLPSHCDPPEALACPSTHCAPSYTQNTPAGGIGLSIHCIRATGSYIRGTNGTSNGIVPMLRVFNDTARCVHGEQGVVGALRAGGVCMESRGGGCMESREWWVHGELGVVGAWRAGCVCVHGEQGVVGAWRAGGGGCMESWGWWVHGVQVHARRAGGGGAGQGSGCHR